jgi:hypothetical protein
LGFDGGRVDPYHISEKRGRFKGSLWLGLKGLRWALGELGKLNHNSPTHTGTFEFLRDGYRTLELSCLSNRGGRFVELCEYHGGSQRGNLRIPEGRKGAGWAQFGRELRQYFLPKTEQEESGSAGVQISGTTQFPASEVRRGSYGKDSNWNPQMERRGLRGRDHATPKLAHDSQEQDFRKVGKETKVNSRVKMSTTEPRPTRKWAFKWNPKPNTLWITISEGQARSVSWVGLSKVVRPTEKPKLITRELESAHLDISGSLICLGASERQNGEASGANTEAIESRAEVAEPLVVEEAEETMSTTEEPEPTLVAHWVGEDNDKAGYASAETEEVAPPDSTDLALVRVDLAVGEGVMVAKEVDGGAKGPSGVLDLDYGNPTEERKKLVPVELEDPQSPITCIPLAMLEPSESKGSERSKRVKRQYRSMCKLVGFPLDSHEQQCVDLLMRIEATRPTMKKVVGPQRRLLSSSKGTRELKNLASSVNYDGKHRGCS